MRLSHAGQPKHAGNVAKSSQFVGEFLWDDFVRGSSRHYMKILQLVHELDGSLMLTVGAVEWLAC